MGSEMCIRDSLLGLVLSLEAFWDQHHVVEEDTRFPLDATPLFLIACPELLVLWRAKPAHRHSSGSFRAHHQSLPPLLSRALSRVFKLGRSGSTTRR